MAVNKAKKYESLVDGLKECWQNFDITAQQLMNPSLEILILFYERFIQEFGIQIDTIITNLYIRNDENEEILYLYVSYSCTNLISNMLNLATVPTFAFTFINLINPMNDKNLLNRMVFLTNYLYYVDKTIHTTILPLKGKVLEEIDSVDELNKEINIANEHLKSAGFTKATNIDQIENQKHKQEKLKENMKEDQIETQEIQKIIEIKLQPQNKFLNEENYKLIKMVDKLLIKQKELEPLVVDKHESIVAERNKLQKEVEELQLIVNENNLKSKTETKSHLLEISELINNLFESSHLNKEQDKYDFIQENISETETIFQTSYGYRQTDKDIQNKRSELFSKLAEGQKLFQTLYLESESRKQTLNNEIVQSHFELEEIRNKLEMAIAEVADLIKSDEYISDCYEDYKKNIEVQNLYFVELYLKYLETISDNEIPDLFPKLKGLSEESFE